jgi:hypothetical protein
MHLLDLGAHSPIAPLGRVSEHAQLEDLSFEHSAPNAPKPAFQGLLAR